MSSVQEAWPLQSITTLPSLGSACVCSLRVQTVTRHTSGCVWILFTPLFVWIEGILATQSCNVRAELPCFHVMVSLCVCGFCWQQHRGGVKNVRKFSLSESVSMYMDDVNAVWVYVHALLVLIPGIYVAKEVHVTCIVTGQCMGITSMWQLVVCFHVIRIVSAHSQPYNNP